MKKNNELFKWDSAQVFNFAIEILFLVIVFLTPTIYDRRLGIVFSGTKVAWLRAFIAVILSVWSVKLLVTRKHRFARTPLDWPILSYIFAVTIATLTSVHVYSSLFGFYGRYEGLTTWYLFVLLFFIATNYIRNFRQIKRVTINVVSAATLMAVYSIIQRQEIDPYMWGGVVTWQRVIGTIGQPNFLAGYMLMALFMNLALLMFDQKESKGEINWGDQLIPIGYFLFTQVIYVVMIYNLDAQNIFLWYFGFFAITASAIMFSYTYEMLHPLIFNTLMGLTMVLNYICILYTQSRGGYMGLFTGGAVFFLVVGRKWIFESWKRLTAVGMLIFLISAFTMLQPEYSPFQRFASEVTTEKARQGEEVESKLELKGAAGSRGETWKSAAAIIVNYPLFGIGPEVLKMIFPRYETDLFRFKEAFHVKQDRCHNETFDIPVTKGLIAFFTFLWVLFVFFRVGWLRSRAVKSVEEKLMLAGLMAAAVGYLIQNQFSFGVVAITSLFWVILAMVMIIGGEPDLEAQDKAKINWADIPWIPITFIGLVTAYVCYVSFIPFRADVLFKTGKSYLEMRQFPQAVEYLDKSAAVFPLEGTTISHLGISYLNSSQGQPNQRAILKNAIDTLRYGTLIDAYNADNYYILSKIYALLYTLGDASALAQAKEHAEIAIKIDPYYAEVYNLLGFINEQQNDLASAAKNHEKAFMINPNLTEPVQSLEKVLKKLSRPNDMIKVMDRAVAKYGDYPNILERAAIIYINNGQIDKALAVTDRMVQIDPKASSGRTLRAEIYIRKGAIDKAFTDLQEVAVNDPRNVVGHINLGRVYLLKGDKARAMEEYNQVLMLDPNNQVAKDMLQRAR